MGDRSSAADKTTRTMFPAKTPGKKGKKKSLSPPIPSGRLISVDNKPVRDGEGPDGEKTEKMSHTQRTAKSIFDVSLFCSSNDYSA